MAGNKFPSSLLFTCFLIFASLFSSSYAHQDCTSHPLYTKNIYTNCVTLPSVNSFLHWNYHQSNHTVDIAYRENEAPFTFRWIAWCLNPSGDGVIGSECLVGEDFHQDVDFVYAYTSIATRESYGTRSYLRHNDPLKSFSVQNIAGEYIDYNEMIIYATLVLPNGNTNFTQVGQYGDSWRYWNSEPYSTYIATIDFAAVAPASDTVATSPTPTTDVATAPTTTTDTVTAPTPAPTTTTDTVTAPTPATTTTTDTVTAPTPAPTTTTDTVTAPTPATTTTTDTVTVPTPAPTTTMDTITVPTLAPTTNAATSPITNTGLLKSIKSQKNVGHYNIWKKAAYTGVLVIFLVSVATLLAFTCYSIVIKTKQHHGDKGDNGGSFC